MLLKKGSMMKTKQDETKTWMKKKISCKNFNNKSDFLKTFY